MDAEGFARRWYLAAITYFAIGIALGVYMGASEDHSLFTVHAHINLLGWASMGLTGLLYRSFPAAARSRLAVWHFWLYQIAVPVMLVSLALLISGSKVAGPVTCAAAVVILISVLLFWSAIFRARSGSMPSSS